MFKIGKSVTLLVTLTAGESISVRGVGRRVLGWDPAGEAVPLYVDHLTSSAGGRRASGKGKGYNHVRAANAMPGQNRAFVVINHAV